MYECDGRRFTRAERSEPLLDGDARSRTYYEKRLAVSPSPGVRMRAEVVAAARQRGLL
jgi:hypothetical protein